MTKLATKGRLIAMNFLEFAVWGSYLISMGMFLAVNGLGDKVFWFYTVQGLVSIIMPAIIGIIADRWIPAQITLSLCHIIAGTFMAATGYVAADTLAATGSLAGAFGTIFTLYTVSVAFFMPTIGLSNSVAFSVLEQNGMDTVRDFPPIRVFGTIGFIFAELLVNFAAIDGVAIQFTANQFYTSAIFSIALAIYCLSLPKCRCKPNSSRSIADALGLKAFKLFRRRDMAIFFIFSMLLGVSLQITNSYGSDYIYFFSNPELVEYAHGFMDGWWAHNPTFLISISQCAEALCILAIPFCLNRFGIKGVMIMAMFAWVLRFGLFGIGDTNFPGVIFLMMSCIVYGVAFDFFNVSGGLYVDKQTDPAQRSSAQGLFMLMTNGIGASLGTFIAGTCVVNKLVKAEGLTAQQQLAGWHNSWLIFACYALVVTVLFILIFRENKSVPRAGDKELKLVEDELDNPGGMI